MKTSKALRKKIAAVLLAGAMALPISYGALPAPQAEAGWGSVIGAVIGGAVANIQMNEFINKYDKTEEGRQELFQQLQEKYGVNSNPYLNRRLDTIMANLTTGIGAVDSSIYDRPYNYFINNQQEFNAFCTLGHNISVNTGLFNMLTIDDEIAFVIGHEMGHGQKNHPVSGMKKSLWTQVAGAATGTNLGVYAAAVYDSTQNTRPQEKEADKLAFEYITHTNYNPGAGAALWQHVLEASKSQPSELQKFLSDHPSDDSRRDTNAKYLTDYSGGHVTVKDGTVSVNGEKFVTPAATGSMSTAERSYFVAGNLAAAFHNGHNKTDASVQGNTVMLGAQPILTCTSGDESASALADRLNAIKDKK